MKVTLLNTKEIDIDSPGFKENYFQHIYYLGTYINSPIIESDPDLKKQIEECIDKLPPNSHSEISKFAKLLEETTDATIDDYSEKIGDIIKTLTTNAILKEQFFTLATTANLNILSSATSSPAPTPITDSAPIPEATTTHIPTEEDSTPITAKHTTSTEAPPTPTTKTTTPVKPTTTTSATKKNCRTRIRIS